MRKNLKKTLLTLLAVVTMTVIFCFGASALEPTGKCGDNVYWDYNSSTGELVISGTGAMTDYSLGGSPFDANDIKSVVIKDSVTTIGSFAFEDCDSLQSVTIGNSVTTIGDEAFSYCESLQSITIPDSVTTIDMGAFVSCSNLKSIAIGSGITTIGNWAFYDCTSLQSITIPDSVTTIESEAFCDCTNLQSVTIGKGVTTIGSAAFAGCDILDSVTIPDSVIAIGDMAFGYDHSFTDGYGDSYWRYNDFEIKGVKGSAAEKYAKDNGFKFVEHTTHTHSYTAKVVTPATLTTNGKAEYKCSCGDVQKTVTIAKIKSLSLSATSYIYDGKNKTPKLTVKDSNGKTLVKNTDYKITVASKRAGIGRYTVKVAFIGNYSGTKNLYFYILPGKSASVKSASQTVSSVKISWSAVPGAAGYTIYRYSSSKKAYVKEGTTEGTTFTVKSLYAGKKYTFRVVAYGKTAAGKVYNSETYALLKTATKTKTPVISDVAVYKGKVKLFWTATTGETGYTVYYSTSKTSGFKKYKNYESNSGYVNNLTSGKTYYFKVRTYIKTDSGYVYSAWSNIKGVKVK